MIARMRPSPIVLARLDDLHVLPGEVCQDPRLYPLKLQDGRTALRVRVIDESSMPITNAWVIARGMTYTHGPPLTDGSGVCVVRVEGLPVDAEVGALGYRKRYIGILEDDVTIVLRAGIAVRFYTNAQVSSMHPEYSVRVRLFEVDTNGSRGEPAIRIGSQADDVLTSGTGGAPVMVAPGIYECVPLITVVRPDMTLGGPVDLANYPRITVIESMAEQRCEIIIPQSEIEAAVAKYRSM